MYSPRVLLTSLVWFLLVGVVACGDSPSKVPPSITLTPSAISVKAGESVEVTASYVDSDGISTTATDATFSVSGTTVASVVTGTGGKATVKGLAEGKTVLTVSGMDVTSTFSITVTAGAPATLSSIQVTPSNATLALGTTRQMTATGVYSDATTKDITASVTWTSSDPTHATIATTGIATSVALGATTITAALGAVSGTTQLTVTKAELLSIAVTPAAATVNAGKTQQFVATGKYSDLTTQDLSTQVTWASSAAAATISNADGSKGLATGVSVGAANITATSGSVTGTAVLTVSAATVTAIVVTPADTSNPIGTKRSMIATGTFSDATTRVITTDVTWTSSDVAIATISDAGATKGEATAVGAGTATITAAFGGITATTTFVVTTATLVSITVSPATTSTAQGHKVAYTAQGKFSDNSTQDLTNGVAWSSSDIAIATISNVAGEKGQATTLAVGTTTITATSALGPVSGNTLLTVTAVALDAISVTPSPANVIPGGKQQLVALEVFSDSHTVDVSLTAVWASSATGVATVDSKGLVTGVAVGSANITATADSVTGTAVVNVVGPSVVSTRPRDTAFGIRATTPIVVTFNQAIDRTSVTVQPTAGACTGSVQLSADSFASCLGLGAPTFDTASTTASAQPAVALTASTTYKIRVTNAVKNAAGATGEAFSQAAGFTTAAAGACATGLVISQLYGGGGNGGSVFDNDFIELHNGGATPVDLTGLAVQFTSAGGPTPSTSNWGVQPLPSKIIPPGGYFLIQEGTNTTAHPGPLPTPDFVPADNPDLAAFAMGATSGKVALTAFTTPLTGSCPLGLTNDLVGYGTAPATGGCFEGSNSTAAPGPATAAIRKTNGCTDANDNAADFTVAAPTPRNAATAPAVCACFATFDDNGEPAMSFLSNN